jgi:hypothetical protein
VFRAFFIFFILSPNESEVALREILGETLCEEGDRNNLERFELLRKEPATLERFELLRKDAKLAAKLVVVWRAFACGGATLAFVGAKLALPGIRVDITVALPGT